MHEDQRVFERGRHARHDLEVGIEGLVLFDRYDAVLADLVHGLGDDIADGAVGVGRNSTHLGNLSAVLGGLRHLLEAGGYRDHTLVDATLDGHRVVTRRHHARAFGEDRPGEYGRGGRAVTGNVRGLGGDLFYHLGTHVFDLVFELDLLGYRYAVLGHVGRAPGLFENHVTTAWAEGYCYGVGKGVDAFEKLVAGFLAETNYFGHVTGLSSERVLPDWVFFPW